MVVWVGHWYVFVNKKNVFLIRILRRSKDLFNISYHPTNTPFTMAFLIRQTTRRTALLRAQQTRSIAGADHPNVIRSPAPDIVMPPSGTCPTPTHSQ